MREIQAMMSYITTSIILFRAYIPSYNITLVSLDSDEVRSINQRDFVVIRIWDLASETHISLEWRVSDQYCTDPIVSIATRFSRYLS